MRGSMTISVLIGMVVAAVVGVVMIPMLAGTISSVEEGVLAPEAIVAPVAPETGGTDTGGETYSDSGWLTSIQVLASLVAIALAAYKFLPWRRLRRDTVVSGDSSVKAKLTIFGIRIK